jgi:asparagine synthase (glutamine-hydrolysing)
MCGIGVILSASADSIGSALNVFNAAQAHRGPDDEGTYRLRTEAGLALGLAHRRLSILDLSPAGHQPMLDEATGNVIVFNGEIYNYRELASVLEAKGERFVGTSDTEVLLKAYRHFDALELLRRLRGMFAFAIWDAQRQKLLLARDPVGIKPLYYVGAGSQFACASEVGALVRAGLVSTSIDAKALDSFLAFGSVQAPLCIYQGARTLLPGHLLWVHGDATTEQPISYWDWGTANAKGGPGAIAYWLQESMRRHLVADVPLGIFLSGGFDSTALTALAMQVTDTPVQTFTIGFPEVPEMSEADSAASIAARFGTVHHSIEVRQSDFRRELPAFFAAMDQPSDDGLNVFLISQGVARAGIKACLHGVGGDELFGGYPSFTQVPKVRILAALPAWLRRILAQAVHGDGVARAKLANLLRSDLSLLETFLIRRSVFSYEQRRTLLGGEPPLGRSGVPTEWSCYAADRIVKTLDTFGAVSMLELAQYAGNKLLVDGDVMSMAHGLELRFPLLDVDLIHCVLATPESQKRNRSRLAGKPALAQSVNNFPTDLMSRRKRGFTLPLQRWLHQGLRDERQSVAMALVQDFGLVRAAVDATWHRLDMSQSRQEWLRSWQLYALGNWRRQDAPFTGARVVA